MKRENETSLEKVNSIIVEADKLIDKSNIFIQIATRGADPNRKSILDFKVLNDEKLIKLSKNMLEINRATNSFGKQNSQTTSKMMSLNMICQSPYRRLKQCLAQIERKRAALKETIFRLKKDKIEIDKLLYKKKKLESKLKNSIGDEDPVEISFEIELMDTDIQEKACGIADSSIYIEASLKEIGMFQEAYNEIKSSYGIPDNWDEEDFEKSEIEEHVKTSFLHAVRDVIMTGKINVGTQEYLEQYGINPTAAFKLVKMYLKDVDEKTDLEKGHLPNINMLYNFLDNMYDLFKDSYKHAMKRSGLTNLISEEYLYREIGKVE